MPKTIELDVPSFTREETARLEKKHPNWDKSEVEAKVQDNLDYFMDYGKLPK